MVFIGFRGELVVIALLSWELEVLAVLLRGLLGVASSVLRQVLQGKNSVVSLETLIEETQLDQSDGFE